jgi:hypothetical protein
MKSVFKIQVESRAHAHVTKLPVGAMFLDAQMQHGWISIWFEVDADERRHHERNLLVVGTGHHYEDKPMAYIATVQDGELVWHVYEVL